MLHTPETFTGTSTASIDGTGTVTLLSDKGVTCRGPYWQVPGDNTAEADATEPGSAEDDSSIATLRCDDGRTGQVRFLVGQRQAVGTGMLGADIVTLTLE